MAEFKSLEKIFENLNNVQKQRQQEFQKKQSIQSQMNRRLDQGPISASAPINVSAPVISPPKTNGWDWNTFGQSFVRSTGKMIDAVIPFTDPIQQGVIKGMNEDNWFNQNTRDWLNEAFQKPTDTKQKVLDGVTEIGASLIPIAGAYKATDLGLDAINKVPKAFKGLNQPKGNAKVLDEVQRGAGAGLVWGTQNEINKALNGEDVSLGSAATNISLEMGLGGVLDAIPSAIRIGRQAVKESKAALPQYTGQPSEEVLQQMSPNAFGPSQGMNDDLFNQLMNVNKPVAPKTPTIEKIEPKKVEMPKIEVERVNRQNVNEVVNTLTDVKKVEAPKVEKIEPKKNEDPEFQEAVKEQYEYLKASMKNRKGVQQGNIIRDETGEVVDRYGRISENPGWYQEFYRANKKAPTNKDLWELAEKHVREGFADEVGRIPSWDKQQKSKEYDRQIDDLTKHLEELEANPPSKDLKSELERLNIHEINPNTIAKGYNQKTWFHGTGTKGLTADMLDDATTSHEGLFGQGVYLTDNPRVAEGYAKARGKKTGNQVIYETNVDVDSVLDLESPMSPDVVNSLLRTTNELDEFYQMETGEIGPFSQRLLQMADEGKTTEEAITMIRNEIREFSLDLEIPSSEFAEYFNGLAIHLKEAGYDGITHTGGGRVGKEPHRVLILLDPNNTNTKVKPGRKHVTKFEPSKDPFAKDEITGTRKLIEAIQKEKELVTKPMRVKKNPNKKLPDNVKAMRKDPVPLPNRGTQSKKTITRQQVLNNMRKNLGVVIRTGKLGPVDKEVQGYFKVNPEVIRSKRHGDLQVISHEIGHHLDKKHNLTSDQFDNELLKLGKQTSADDYTTEEIREEGLAEFIRLYLTDPQQAKKDAPRFFNRFEKVLPKNVMKGLKKTQSDLDTWITQGAEKRFEGKIDFSGKEKTSIGERVDKFYSQFVDKFDTLKKVEKEITGKVSDASKSLYKKARLSVGAPKKGELILQDLKDILKPIDKYGYSMKDVSKYAAARHARELEDLGIESGFTLEEIEAVLKKYDNPTMQNIQQQLVKYNNKLVDMLQEAQILSEEAVKAMREKYPDYVPFYRFFEDDMAAGWGNKGFANLTNPVKRLKGSTRDVINPLESMIKNTFAVVNAVEKNKVGLELSRLADVEGAGRFIERLDGKAQDNKDSIVTVFEKGDKVQYKLDPELYRSIQMLDEEATNILVKILSAPTNILRAGATLTPEFMLRNPIRDQFQAYVVSEYGYNPIIDLPRGLWHVIRGKQGKSDIYKQWVENGGGYGNYLSQDRNYLKEQLSQLKKEGSKFNKGVHYIANPKQWLRYLQSLSELSEEATKVGEFRKAVKKKGATPQEAAFQSRDLMDFGRSGSITKTANRVVAFLNANIQGKDKLIRTFKQHPVRSTIRAVNGITLPTIGAYLAMEHLGNEKQKEAWRNTPKWLKDSFFILPIPGTDELARIPKPFDLAPIFANLPERMMDDMYENDPEGWNEFVKSTGSNLAKIPLMLTALTPMLENITNYSFFTGGPVVPMRDQDLLPQDQYGVNTSLLARTIGEQTAEGGNLSFLPDQSPYKVDNLIRGYGAGLGGYATDVIDMLIKPLRSEKQPTPEAKKWSELPVVSAFTVDQTGGGKVMGDFYDVLEKMRKKNASANRNETTFKDKDVYKALTKINKEISDLRKEYREVQWSTTLNPKMKRERLDRLDEQMNALAEEGVSKAK